MVDQTKLALEILDYVHMMSPRIEDILTTFGSKAVIQKTILSLIASGEIAIDKESGRCDIR